LVSEKIASFENMNAAKENLAENMKDLQSYKFGYAKANNFYKDNYDFPKPEETKINLVNIDLTTLNTGNLKVTVHSEVNVVMGGIDSNLIGNAKYKFARNADISIAYNNKKLETNTNLSVNMSYQFNKDTDLNVKGNQYGGYCSINKRF
jgi:hypothetical protein